MREKERAEETEREATRRARSDEPVCGILKTNTTKKSMAELVTQGLKTPLSWFALVAGLFEVAERIWNSNKESNVSPRELAMRKSWSGSRFQSREARFFQQFCGADTGHDQFDKPRQVGSKLEKQPRTCAGFGA